MVPENNRYVRCNLFRSIVLLEKLFYKMYEQFRYVCICSRIPFPTPELKKNGPLSLIIRRLHQLSFVYKKKSDTIFRKHFDY